MIGKELAERGTRAGSDAFRGKSLGGILLIFFLNLIGFWLILPVSLLVVGFLVDSAFSLSPLSTGSALISNLFAAIFLCFGLGLSLYSILIFAYFGDGMPIACLPPDRLVDKGPYGRSRHPIYLGYTMALVGLGIYVRSASFLLIVLPSFTLVWIVYALLHEERVLGGKYDDSYARYRKSTPLLFSKRSIGKREQDAPHPVMYMLVSVVFKALNRILFDAEISGEPAPRTDSPIIVVANHANYLDPFIINAYLKDYVRCSTTESVFRNPLSRRYFVAMGTFPVPRYRQAQVGHIRKSLDLLEANTSLALFPEGERSWDGAPLEISDAVTKLLQKSAVPILAVNLSGNYNAFPRWASRPRRAKIKLHFHPLFVLAKGATLEENKKILSEKLHSPGKSYDESSLVQGGSLAKGLPLLMWRCPLCKANESLSVEGGLYLHCCRCNGRWELTHDYHLNLLENPSGHEEPPAKTLGDWHALIKDIKETTPIAVTSHILREHEEAYLESRQVRYSCFHGLKKCISHKGRVILTDRRLIFFDKKHQLFDDLDAIERVTIEGNKVLELGFRDKVISIKFKHESPLKWQAYVHRIKANNCTSD